jgi:hypothetical protein
VLAVRAYESDAANALQDRLLRNRGRLFTFLHHDGVSWNNNVAENAIKRCGYYRDDVGSSIKETVRLTCICAALHGNAASFGIGLIRPHAPAASLSALCQTSAIEACFPRRTWPNSSESGSH